MFLLLVMISLVHALCKTCGGLRFLVGTSTSNVSDLRCKLASGPCQPLPHILLHPNCLSHQSCCLALHDLEQQPACSLCSHQCQSSEARSDHLSQSVVLARHDLLISCCRLGISSKSLFGLCLQSRRCHRLKPGHIRPPIQVCLRAAGLGGTLLGDPCLRSGLRSSLRSRAAEVSWMTKAGLLTSGDMLVFSSFE